MMMLSMAPQGKALKIVLIKGQDAQKQLLANMGFVPGESISMVSALEGNVIVGIKEGRVALAEKLARRIMVEEVVS